MKPCVALLGVGAFAHSMMSVLKKSGADVACYLTREYGHYGPAQCGTTWDFREEESPLPQLNRFQPDFVIPMSLAWKDAPWAEELVATYPVLCAQGEGFLIERERYFATQLCESLSIPVAKAYALKNRQEAFRLIHQDPRPYVLKNPLCSPHSPIRATVCRTVEETLGWLDHIDDSEGVFLQEYMGTAEAGHFAFVSNGEIYSVATNQEYKKAYDGNMGPTAGAPLGGVLEQDPDDRYGLAQTLIHPLRGWLQQVGFQGPLQVTAVKRDGVWHAIEYNIRFGVTSGPLLMNLLKNPLEVFMQMSRNQSLTMDWHPERRFGVSLTLAGYGYPYVIPESPRLPITIEGQVDCDLWWNEVEEYEGKLYGGVLFCGRG